MIVDIAAGKIEDRQLTPEGQGQGPSYCQGRQGWKGEREELDRNPDPRL